MIRVAVSTIVVQALKELNAISSGEAAQPELLVDGLELLNQIFDDWNAKPEEKVYADTFTSYTLSPNTQPHTIGSGGTFNTGAAGTQPPQTIKGIQVVLTGGTPNPYVYLRPRDARWWQQRPSPTVTTSYPTDFYYDPTWSPTSATPLGSIYFWPVPTTAYPVQVWARQILAQVTAATTLGLPPGYSYAMRMELAARWYSGLRKPWTSEQQAARVAAMDIITTNNNDDPVRIATRDAGMPGGGQGSLPNFMWPYGGVGQ